MMKILSHTPAISNQLNFRPLSSEEPPADEGPKDNFLPTAATIGAGLVGGFGGFHLGLRGGVSLGILMTPASSSFEKLLSNMVLGARVGAIVGTLSVGALAALAVYELTNSQGE